MGEKGVLETQARKAEGVEDGDMEKTVKTFDAGSIASNLTLDVGYWMRAVKKQGLLNREASVRKNVPDFLEYKTVLYVGVRPGRMQLLDLFLEAGYEADVVEIWPRNYAYIQELQNDRFRGKEKALFKNIYCQDIKAFAAIEKGPYDVVVWWHGPEHMPKADLPAVLENLFRMTEQVLILGCPWGATAQGALGGNPSEAHVSCFTTNYFEALGFKTSTLGRENKGGSNILSWKRKDPRP
jgi:hypothetical protein